MGRVNYNQHTVIMTSFISLYIWTSIKYTTSIYLIIMLAMNTLKFIEHQHNINHKMSWWRKTDSTIENKYFEVFYYCYLFSSIALYACNFFFFKLVYIFDSFILCCNYSFSSCRVPITVLHYFYMYGWIDCFGKVKGYVNWAWFAWIAFQEENSNQFYTK